MKAFNIGDKASLKSGGPLMTVIGSDNIVVSCTWFSQAQLHTEVFQVEWLDHIEIPDAAHVTSYEAIT